jgi:hypothetical protein
VRFNIDCMYLKYVAWQKQVRLPIVLFVDDVRALIKVLERSLLPVAVVYKSYRCVTGLVDFLNSASYKLIGS